MPRMTLRRFSTAHYNLSRQRRMHSAIPGRTPGKNVPFPLANAEAYLSPHIHSPSVVQWNASVQRRLSATWVFSISYLGNKTSHLWIGNEVNPAVFIPGTCA